MSFQNPYFSGMGMGMMPQYPQPAQLAPQSQVVKVNGENGARAYQIGANSSALLLDESGLMVWLVTSDGMNGYSGNTSAARKNKPDDAAGKANDRHGQRSAEPAGDD